MSSDSDDDGELSEQEKDDLAADISEIRDALRHMRQDAALYARYGAKLELLLGELEEATKRSTVWVPFDFHAQDHVNLFRFDAHQITEMADALLPEYVVHEERRYRCDRRTALCIVLARLAYPMRWSGFRVLFGGKSNAWLSSIYHETLSLLYVYARKELWTFSDGLVDEIPGLVEACEERFGMRCWGFMDGNHADLSRPTELQRAFYSGYEGHHLLRSLAIVRPDGLFECAFGPFPGSGSDTSMFGALDMERKLRDLHAQVEQTFDLTPAQRVYVLADSIFTATIDVVTPYDYDKLKAPPAAGAAAAMIQQRQSKRFFNLIHSQSRIAVEWGFGRVLNNWQSLSFKALMKVHHTEPEKAMLVAMLLTNFIVVARGAQHQEYFGVAGPSFDEYLAKVAAL